MDKSIVSSLTQHFASAHPEVVARSLMNYPSNEIGGFINLLPRDKVKNIVAALPLSTLTDMFNSLNQDKQQLILKSLPFKQAHLILMGLPTEMHHTLLKQMGGSFTRLHQHYEKIKLTSPGKMMNTDLIIIDHHATVRGLKQKLTAHTEPTANIFVLDEHHHYQGYIPALQLVNQEDDVIVNSLAKSTKHFIHVNHNLEAVISNAGWKTQTFLPVLDAEKHFLGVIEIQALYEFIMNSANQHLNSPLVNIMHAFIEVVGALVSSCFTSTRQPKGPSDDTNHQ